MSKKLKKGDRVTWNTFQGTTSGRIVDVRTKDFQLHKQQFTASKNDPRYIVESDVTHEQAAHTADALKRKS